MHIHNHIKKLNNLQFYSDSCKQQMKSDVNKFTCKLQNLEIKDINYHIKYLEKVNDKLKQDLENSQMKKSELKNFFNVQEKVCDKLSEKQNIIHEKKFSNIKNQTFNFQHLKNNQIYLHHTNNVTDMNKKTNNNHKEKWFINLTNIEIPKNVTNTVALGSKFSFNTNINQNDIIDIIKNMEATFKYMKHLEKQQSDNFNELIFTQKIQKIRNNITNSLNNNINKKKHIPFNDLNFQQNIKYAQKFLKENNNIMFIQADKSGSTVCINRSDYINKANILLSDKNTYSIIKCDKTILKKWQNAAKNILQDWNKKGYLERKYKDIELTQTDTDMAKFYGLPKLHKNGHPLRPVVSSINAASEHLAKYMYNILKKAIKSPTSHIKNNISLKQDIEKLKIPEDHIMISLDVSSLYTNVTKEAVLNSIDKRCFDITTKSIIPVDEIKKATKFLFDNLYFTFNETTYKQTKGLPMGSSISGFFADLVMEDLEITCLQKLSFKPIWYKRYVDDIFACIQKIKSTKCYKYLIMKMKI